MVTAPCRSSVVRLRPEGDLRLVHLGFVTHVLQEAGGAADEEHEEPGGERIERTAVTDPLLAERATGHRDDVV